jgi:hypothetical protein
LFKVASLQCAEAQASIPTRHGGSASKNANHLTAAKLLPDDDLLGRVDIVNLKHVLGALPATTCRKVIVATSHQGAAHMQITTIGSSTTSTTD